MNKIALITQFPQIGKTFSKTASQTQVNSNTNFNKSKKLEDKDLIVEFVNNENIINAIVKTLTILNDKEKKITVNSQTIKELLIQNVHK